MSRFNDLESADRALKRIGEKLMRPTDRFVAEAFDGCPHPDQALKNLERWIDALSNPGTLFSAFESTPELSRLFVTLLGSGHHIGDVLAQNPELANLVLEPEQLNDRPDVEAIVRHGRRMLGESISYTHQLDRLRFLRQKWYVRLAAADLADLWPQPEIWAGISTLAEALLILLRDAVWQNYAQERDLPEECPLGIVGMGKLGGGELNYSSDVDLLYVLRDDADEKLEKHAARFCEAFGRALADRMGRGSLYRIDLRLRPFGSKGALAPRQRAYESYYQRYAQPWEHLALIRSRWIAGDPAGKERWEAMRREICFQPTRGEWAVEELVRMRERVEDQGGEHDLKRGAGGIRDVEFAVQIYQMLFGFRHEELQARPTLQVIDQLQQHELFDTATARSLSEGYEFLRKVEHGIQLAGEKQTHRLPEDRSELEFLARRVGYPGPEPFESALQGHRTAIRYRYEELLPAARRVGRESHPELRQRLGPAYPQVLDWIETLPDSELFIRSLEENEGSAERAERVARLAPALLPSLKRSVAATEQVLTGEILEQFSASAMFANLPPGFDQAKFEQRYRRMWLRTALTWVLQESAPRFGLQMADLSDLTLKALLQDAPKELAVIALGSYASRDLGPFSDLDLLLLAPDGFPLEEADKAARQLLTRVQAARNSGAPLAVDLRLRPAGRSGALVSSYAAFLRYEAEFMESWERFALGRSRLVRGDNQVIELVNEAAFGRPVRRETLEELLHIKHRVETERVLPSNLQRDVKLGHGGLDDIVWLAQLHLMKFAPVRASVEHADVENWLKAMADQKKLTALEHDTLLEAYRFLRQVRVRMALLGFENDVLPENPDKLRVLAEGLGLQDGNAFLKVHHDHRQAVRGIYEEGLERLQS
jgi:glutamate-ammonia-ligase adenylyltransferase